MTAEQALADLRWHWGSVYRIWHDPRRALPWLAVMAGRDVLRAPDAGALRLAIRADYDAARGLRPTA